MANRESKPSAQRQRTARIARTTRQINGAKFLVGGAKVGALDCSPRVSRKSVPSGGELLASFWFNLDRKTHGVLRDMDLLCSSHVAKIRVWRLSSEHFEDYVYHLKQNELYTATRSLYLIHDYGYSVIDILDSFFSFVKNTHVLDENEKYKLLPPLCEYISYFHNIHEDEIELALFTHTILPLFQTN